MQCRLPTLPKFVSAAAASNATGGVYRTLSLMPIVMIFLVLPMDSILWPLRIERLNLPARAAFDVSMDAAPREAARNESAWAQAL